MIENKQVNDILKNCKQYLDTFQLSDLKKKTTYDNSFWQNMYMHVQSVFY